MTSKLMTVAFWSDVAERAVKSAAQAPLLALGLSDTGPLNAFELDLGLGAGFAAGGALISVLTSLASAPIGEGGTASVLPSPPAPPPPPPEGK